MDAYVFLTTNDVTAILPFETGEGSPEENAVNIIRDQRQPERNSIRHDNFAACAAAGLRQAYRRY